MKKKVVLFCAFVLLVSLSSSQTSRLGVNRFENGTAINFSYGNVKDTSLLYYRIGLEYLFIDDDYEIDTSDPLLDKVDLFMQTGIQYGFLLNLPDDVNLWTGTRFSLSGIYGDLGGYYMLTNGLGVSLNIGYKFIEGIVDSEGRDGFFFGGGIVF